MRTLEGEVKDLKDLLDEKDEKIDVLSRIHSFSSPSQRAASIRSPSTTGSTKSPGISDSGEGVIHVEKFHTQKKASQSPYAAFSTTRGFASRFSDLISTRPRNRTRSNLVSDAFDNHLINQGKIASNLSIDALTNLSPPLSHGSPTQAIKTPPRLVSDQLINIFFQEWAPLYPVVHRPTILKAYGEYLNNSDSVKPKLDSHVMAQLNLVFGIAALSSSVSD